MSRFRTFFKSQQGVHVSGVDGKAYAFRIDTLTGDVYINENKFPASLDGIKININGTVNGNIESFAGINVNGQLFGNALNYNGLTKVNTSYGKVGSLGGKVHVVNLFAGDDPPNPYKPPDLHKPKPLAITWDNPRATSSSSSSSSSSTNNNNDIRIGEKRKRQQEQQLTSSSKSKYPMHGLSKQMFISRTSITR